MKREYKIIPLLLSLFLAFIIPLFPKVNVVGATKRSQPALIIFNPETFDQFSTTIIIEIRISNAVNVYGFQIEIKYPSGWEFLKIISIEEGDFFASHLSIFVYASNYGFYDYVCGTFTFASTLVAEPFGVSGDGVLARITFEIMGRKNYNITISDSILLDSMIKDIHHETEICVAREFTSKHPIFYSADYYKQEVINRTTDEHDAILTFFGLEYALLNYSGEINWVFHKNGQFVFYQENITGTLLIQDLEGNVLYTRPFEIKTEFFDEGRDGYTKTKTRYQVHWFELTVEWLRYHLIIHPEKGWVYGVYKEWINCENGMWSKG